MSKSENEIPCWIGIGEEWVGGFSVVMFDFGFLVFGLFFIFYFLDLL